MAGKKGKKVLDMTPRRPPTDDVDPEAAAKFIRGESIDAADASNVSTPKPSDVQTPKPSATQTAEDQNAQDNTAANTSAAVVERADGRKRRRMTIYLPPDLAKKLKVASAVEEKEMSDIVTSALQEYLSES